MVLKLYAGTIASGGSGIVALVLAEKQIPFELVLTDLATGEHKTPEFLAMHPFGQIPVIDDDGFVLYEGRAICRYLAEKYSDQGTPLYPKGLKERALVEQAISVESANFWPPVIQIAREVIGKPMRGLDKDQSIIDAGIVDLTAKLDVYEVILGKTKYLAGDEFTLADLIHLMAAHRLADGGVDIMSTYPGPNVHRFPTCVSSWWNDISTRPAWVKLRAEGIKGII
ncbi:glutathione S-transferase [Roridomyces roridus]|uniref:glutathione transferase n=1 Tax=Roridomyces roridus TaxID=1738132 RepID=A0AAD7CAE4_9AGAR|nr:glutathione S-transferase [Roridomyces roridus]